MGSTEPPKVNKSKLGRMTHHRMCESGFGFGKTRRPYLFKMPHFTKRIKTQINSISLTFHFFSLFTSFSLVSLSYPYEHSLSSLSLLSMWAQNLTRLCRPPSLSDGHGRWSVARKNSKISILLQKRSSFPHLFKKHIYFSKNKSKTPRSRVFNHDQKP